MGRSFSEEDAWRLRLRFNRLGPGTGTETVREAVAAVCGIQAQEKRSAALSVRPRTPGSSVKDVETALYEERSVVRTWCMRGTLHLVASEDLPWLLSIFGPHFAPRGPEPRRLAGMGFDADAIERAVEAVRRVLVDGPLTRDEIAHRIREEGIGIDPGGRAPNLLIRQAALRGVVCEVAPKGGSNAYHLLEEWVSIEEPPERETALAELARRYLRAYQPASPDDFAYWSGLLKRDVRAAWEAIDNDLTAVDVGGRPAAMLTADLPDRSPSRDGTVRLLPAYDTYLLGYEADARPVPAAYRSRVWPGAGIVRPTVTVDGAVVATWRLDRSADPPTVLVEPFDPLEADLAPALESEAGHVGRFLGIEPRIEVSEG